MPTLSSSRVRRLSSRSPRSLRRTTSRPNRAPRCWCPASAPRRGSRRSAAGTAHIGTSSRDLKDEEEGLGLVDTPIAYDGIAVIVNPDNPVRGPDDRAARRRSSRARSPTGREVGGEDLPIDLVNRDEASGTREAFKKIVMGDDAVRPGRGRASGDRAGARCRRRLRRARSATSRSGSSSPSSPTRASRRWPSTASSRRRDDRRVEAPTRSGARCTSSPRASPPGLAKELHRLRAVARGPGRCRGRRGLPPDPQAGRRASERQHEGAAASREPSRTSSSCRRQT